jgi:S1 RNA binding domain protein
MELTVGAIVEGTVKSIANFGAFITLPDGKTGMVHISDVANTFVNDIHDHLTEGQSVKVMVTGIDGNKISLSMKRLEAKPQRERTAPQQSRPARPATPPPAPKTADQLFEEKLKQFMNESNTKISSIRQYSDHRTKSRRR